MKINKCIAARKVATSLRELTYYMGLHGRGDIPTLTPARLVLDLATGCKAELT